MNRIHIRGRYAATRFDSPYRCAVISISDPDSDPPQFKIFAVMDESCVLRLRFDDVDVSRYCADELAGWGYQVMLPYLAKQIPPFLRRMTEKGLDSMLIHCEAGVSRSISTAMAICDSLNWDRAIIDWETRDAFSGPPNQHVYDTVCEVFK